MLSPVEQPVRGRMDEHGKFYPSVSAVLDILSPLDGTWIEDEYREAGLTCHAEIARAVRIGILESNVSPRVVALWDWLEARQLTPVHIEESMVSRFGYAGTPDFVGLDACGVCWIVDWKFAEAVPVRYEVQLEAYRHLDLLRNSRLLLVQIPKQGFVKAHVVRPNARHWAAFLAALNVLNWRMG